MSQLTGPAIAFAGGFTSQTFSQTSGNPGMGFPVKPGTRAQDTDGNVYVFVDFVGPVVTLQPVQINADYTAQVIAATGRGPLGVAMTGATSDQGGWVMVYGRTRVIIGLAGVSPSDAANGPTTLQTSVQTKFALQTSISSPVGIGWVSDVSHDTDRFLVDNMWVATDASPGDVSVSDFCSLTSTSLVGVIAVWLNYPTIRYSGGAT